MASTRARVDQLRMAAVVLERYQILFRISRNPVHAWRGLRHAAHADLSVPRWILTYLQDASRRLPDDSARLSNDVVLEALGLKTAGGGPSRYAQAATEDRYLKIAERVHELLSLSNALRDEQGLRGKDDVLERVAGEFQLSFERVRVAFHTVRRGLRRNTLRSNRR